MAQEKLAYIASPVRNIDADQRALVIAHRESLDNMGFRVFDPMRDAPQDDQTGFNIVLTELRWLHYMARLQANGQEACFCVLWHDSSQGSKVDIGMALKLGLVPTLVHEFTAGWETYLETAQEVTHRLSYKQTNPGYKAYLHWNVDAEGRELNIQRASLGVTLASLSRTGGLQIKGVRLVGTDGPHKSYPKVVKEIMDRQAQNRPLW